MCVLASNSLSLSLSLSLFLTHTHTYTEFSSVPWPIGPSGAQGGGGRWGGAIHQRFSSSLFFFFFLQKAVVSSSGMNRDVHSWCCHQVFLLLTKVSFTLQGALKNGFERLSWRATCPNHASFRLVTVARRGSYGSTRAMILLRIYSLALCSK